MKEIIALMDYKGVFGSKHFDVPYRSGYSHEKILEYFERYDYKLHFIDMHKVNFDPNYIGNKVILYTSSEDVGYKYKSFIEDVVYGCELSGGFVIPAYKYLRANNNKVFMEILRKISDQNEIKTIKSKIYGTLEEVLLDEDLKKSTFPKVLKLAEGASGKNVELAKNYVELIKKIKKMCRTRKIRSDLWDYGRSIKHKGYIRESLYRNKFIVQDFIPNLINDWKVYVYYDSYFIFYRPIFKKRGFRASGGGYDNYYYGLKAKMQDGIFDFAERIRSEFNVPQLSLDIAYDGKQFHLLEFQFVYFGTAGIPYSNEYFTKKNNKWATKQNNKDQEYFYVKSIVDYLQSESLK